MQQTFSDGLDSVTVIGNTVRLDFVTFSATEKDAKGNPRAIFSQRIVMAMDGYLRSAEKIQQSMQTLSAMAKNARDAAQKPAEPPPAAKAATPAAPKSKQTPGKRPFP